MLIPEIQPEKVNKIGFDPYKRPSSFLVIDKPSHLGSHDIVDDVRKILSTRKVGHAGALDPFATGALIILVGKYTKYTNAIINFDKAYRATVTLGLATTTIDPEGEIISQSDIKLSDLPSQEELKCKLKEAFTPDYMQYVPIYSSVKVSGNKLRVLARKSKSHTFLSDAEVKFEMPDGEELIVEIPKKKVSIPEFEILSIKPSKESSANNFQPVEGGFVDLEIELSCSKGTYIRQLAKDIGQLFGVPSYLSELTRTRVGKFSLDQAISIADLFALSKKAGLHPQEKEIAELRLNSVE